MKKGLIIVTIVALFAVAGTIAVFAQPSSQKSNVPNSKHDLISKSELEMMSDIIIRVNKGELPVSALKDAEKVLKKEGLHVLSSTVREEYLKIR